MRKERNLIAAKNECTKRFANLKEKYRKTTGKRLGRGVVQDIIDQVKRKRNIMDADISPAVIRRRFYRGSIENNHLAGGQESPLRAIEPIMVEIILQMARIRQCLTPSRALRLINDLIDGTKIQQDLIKWKETNTCNGHGKVGKGYWYGFLKRHRDKLVSRRGQKYELNRQNWTTYSNFANMYCHITHEMLEAGVAEPLPEPVWMDLDGSVCDEQNPFGCKVFHRLIRPDMCIVGDEVGGTISMKGDGHVGGQLFVCGRKEIPKKKISTRGKKFTMIGLTALTGEPVMCILIIEGKLPNGSIESGIDFTVTPTGDPNDSDFILKNSGPGKHFPGGPECQFRNKKVPALVRWHESGSITSTILMEALKVMDDLELFPRTDTMKPFLLLDGHGSRLEMPFLQYINNPKDHWVVCIGVPYGTALWQVGDSKEQNGSFNMAMTKAKDEMLEKKIELGLPDGIVETDMMPLINIAWDKSFARFQKNKKAIVDRGWNPLNRSLLLHPELRVTMTKREQSEEFMLQHNIVLPNKKMMPPVVMPPL